MAHKRTNFTNLQRARIYVRDHATCAFSGKSLWIPDNGVAPFWDTDWVNQIKPGAGPGKKDLDNAVCASATFNAKKNSSAWDSVYFFSHGRPTGAYWDYYGALPKALNKQLRRLRNLHISDWYFNRCLCLVFIGFDVRYVSSKPGPKRNTGYWYRAGWKKLQEYQHRAKADAVDSMESRRLLLDPDRPDVKAMLRLRKASSYSEFRKQLPGLYQGYAENTRLYAELWRAESRSALDKALTKAKSSKLCSPITLQAIQSHYDFAISTGRTPSGQDLG